MSAPRHPFQQPTTQTIEVGGEEVSIFPPEPPGVLAKVLTVTTVTGGQRITFREQTSTSQSNATPIDAENPLEGEAMVPSAFGEVAVDDLVLTSPLPGRDEMIAVPVSNSRSILRFGITSALILSGGTGSVLSDSVLYSVYNPWTAPVVANRVVLFGYDAVASRYYIVSADPVGIYIGRITSSVGAFSSGFVDVSGVGSVAVYNPWSSAIPGPAFPVAFKTVMVAWVSNAFAFQFIAADC